MDASFEAVNQRPTHPLIVVTVFAVTYAVTFTDRGSTSSTGVSGERRSDDDPDGSGFQGEFGLSNFQYGALASLILCGILVGSPLFAQAVRRYNPLRLVAVGTTLWAVAVGLCGFSTDFYSLALCRTFVGFGEAAVLAFAPTFIDDATPPDRVAFWMAILYLAAPVGLSVGLVEGTVIGDPLGWRAVFFFNALLMLPSILFCMCAPPIELKTGRGTRPTGNKTHWTVFWDDVRILCSHKAFVVVVVGCTIREMTVGILMAWNPKAVKEIFDEDNVDTFLGIAVFFSGVVGMLSGGAALDWIKAGVSSGLYLGGFTTLAAASIWAVAYLLLSQFWLFGLVYITASTFLSASLAPVTVALLWSIPSRLRPLATTLMTVTMHVLGDVPSPALFGAMLDGVSKRMDSEADAYRVCMAVAIGLMIVASAIFIYGARLGKDARDYRNAEICGTEYASEAAPCIPASVAVETSPLWTEKQDDGKALGFLTRNA